MSCHTKHGPATYCNLIKATFGVTITGTQWHELRKMAAEQGRDTSKAYADPVHTFDAMDAISAAMPRTVWDSLTPEQQDSLRASYRVGQAELDKGDITIGTVSVVNMLTEGGVKNVIAEADNRIKAAKGNADGPASTGKTGTDVPPLVAEIKQGRATYRFYAIDPNVKDRLEAGFLSADEALKSGQAFPSITTCLGALDKPALPPWAAGVAADFGNEALEELASLPADERDAKLAEWLEVDPKTGRTRFRKEAGNAHNKNRDAAAARGTEVHAIAEAIMRGENPEVPEELAGYVEAAKKFKEEYPDMKYLYTEATVHNPEARTMGTTDAIVEIGGKRYVLDYKTNKSASVYSSVGMQLAAAANAESIVHADGRKEPMPEIHGGIGVGLGPKGEMQVFLFETERDGANHEGFKAARAAWDWKYAAGRDPKPVGKEAFTL